MRHILRFAPAAAVAVVLLLTANAAYAFPFYVNTRYGRPQLDIDHKRRTTAIIASARLPGYVSRIRRRL